MRGYCSSVQAAERQRAGRTRGPEAYPKRQKSEMDESMQVGRALHACSCVRRPGNDSVKIRVQIAARARESLTNEWMKADETSCR